MEGLCGLDTVLDLFSPEEIIFIYMCVLNEISLVFISQSIRSITSTV